MKKLLPTLAGLTLMAAFGAHAGEIGTTQTVTGTMVVGNECSLNLSLEKGNVNLAVSDLVDSHVFDHLILTPTCDSKMWIAYAKPNAVKPELGTLVDQAATNGDNASFYLMGTGATLDSAKQIFVLPTAGTKGTATKVALALSNNGDGEPVDGHTYTYGLKAGLWQD
ncbi:TPA: hypothetical protein ACGTUS_002197 [Salmonella enterica]